jgi:hypothetical protein
MCILLKTIPCLSFFLMTLMIPGFIVLASPVLPLVSDLSSTQNLYLDEYSQIGAENGAPGSHGRSSALPAAEPA